MFCENGKSKLDFDPYAVVLLHCNVNKDEK